MVNPTLTIVRSFLFSLGLLVVMLAVRLQPAYAVPPPPPPDQGLFITTSTKGSLPPSDDPAIRQTRLVTINFEQLAGQGQANGAALKASPTAVKLNLFDQVSLTAVPDRVEANPSGGYTWLGHLPGNELSQVTFVVKDGLMAGNITLPGPFAYQIRYLGNGVHAIAQIDQSLLPAEMDDQVVPPITSHRPPASSQAEADDGSIIDVLVAYTPGVRQAAGGTSALQNLLNLLIAETNTTYQNSGITQRLRLVYSVEVNYPETGNTGTDLDRVTNPSDGYIDEVHSLRNTYGADLVSLMVSGSSNGCSGVAWVMGNVNNNFAQYGFSVVAGNCTNAGFYVFEHELGHNMGSAHDWYVETGDPPYSAYAYSFGYSSIPGQFRTIMSYANECADNGINCTRVGYWSNPDRSYNGHPMGVPEGSFHAADNRKTLNNTALTVANFRQSSGGPPPSSGPLVYNSQTIDDDNNDQSSGNGNGVANCGENIELFVRLRNQGSNAATGISATLSENDPYVSLLYNADSAYPNISGNSNGTNSNDFDLSIAPNTPNGRQVQFNLNVTASNGGPWSVSFNVPVTCAAAGDNFEPDNSANQAKPINSGAPQTHSLAPAGDVDWVTFSLNRESAILLETSGSGGDTVMWLFNNNQNLVEFNDDGGTGYFSRIERSCGVNALPTGDYLVAVAEYQNNDAIPSYNLSFAQTEECGSADAEPLLWDTSHGIHEDFAPDGRYSDLKVDLENRGFLIDQNDTGVLNLTLAQYAALVINLASAWDSPYSAAEAAAIEAYVNNGGGLILLGDEPAAPNANLAPLAERFGVTTGVSAISDTLANLSPHPIVDNVASVSLASGGALSVTVPAQAVALDEAQNIGAAVATAGGGRVVVLGDVDAWTNGLVLSNTTFARNVFSWVTNGGGTGPSLTYQSQTIDDDTTGQSSGNADGIVNCGETIELGVELFNQGLNPAVGVTTSISTTSPYLAQLLNDTSPYPDIPANGTGTNTTPFVFTTASDTPNSHVLVFEVESSATGGGGPWSKNFDVVVSCDSTPNQLPNLPATPNPVDASTGVTILADLSWSGGDPDQDDPVTYDVYLEADNSNPTALVCGATSTPVCYPGTLASNTAYYWQVIATDSNGATRTGPVWSFTTGGANTIPTLAIPDNIPGYNSVTVAVPINFTNHGSRIASTSFSVDFDQDCLAFDPADEDADDIPDAVNLNLPNDFLASVSFDPSNPNAELDFTLFDLTPPLAALPDGVLANLSFNVTCQAGDIAPVEFAATPAPSFGNTNGQSVPGATNNGSVAVQPGTPGDCNNDELLNVADAPAVVLEVFDGDGITPGSTLGGTFSGNPVGCNANRDQAVDAGDVICTTLLVINGPGACEATAADLAFTSPTDPVLPELSLPDQLAAPAGSSVTIPISYTTNGNKVNGVTFSIDYDQTRLSFDPTDADGDGLPDAATLTLPGAFQAASSVTFDASDTDGELDFAILDLTLPFTPLPPQGRLGSITLQVNEELDGSQVASLNFSAEPPASSARSNGQSLPGTPTNNGSILITTTPNPTIFLPVILK